MAQMVFIFKLCLISLSHVQRHTNIGFIHWTVSFPSKFWTQNYYQLKNEKKYNNHAIRNSNYYCKWTLNPIRTTSFQWRSNSIVFGVKNKDNKICLLVAGQTTIYLFKPKLYLLLLTTKTIRQFIDLVFPFLFRFYSNSVNLLLLFYIIFFVALFWFLLYEPVLRNSD